MTMSSTFSDICCINVQWLSSTQAVIGYPNNSTYFTLGCTSHIRNSLRGCTLRMMLSEKVDDNSTWSIARDGTVCWKNYALAYNTKARSLVMDPLQDSMGDVGSNSRQRTGMLPLVADHGRLVWPNYRGCDGTEMGNLVFPDGLYGFTGIEGNIVSNGSVQLALHFP